jgi:hypothetical protein
MTDTKKPGPVEVWLTQKNMQITCRVVYEDESTAELEVDSLSMRGAQREMTGYFIRGGYTPAARWELISDEEYGLESVRRFNLKTAGKDDALLT